MCKFRVIASPDAFCRDEAIFVRLLRRKNRSSQLTREKNLHMALNGII